MRSFLFRYWQTIGLSVIMLLCVVAVGTLFVYPSLHVGIVVGLLITALLAAGAAERKLSLLREINVERSHLLHLTFHQIGEPLTILKWSVESLRDTTQEVQGPDCVEAVREHLRRMDEGLSRLNSIVDTLQMAERVDRGTVECLPHVHDVRSLLEHAAEDWTAYMHAHEQQIQLECEEHLSASIDAELTRVALRQLLENALQYSPNGTVVTLRATRHRRSVHITVEDRGAGIAGVDRLHLFEKYRRGLKAHLLRPDGNGLGLFIVQGIMQSCGGQVHAETRSGGGTIMRLVFPQ